MSSVYTVDQVASLLEMHPKTIRRYIQQGQLQAKKIGKRYRILSRDLNDFVGNQSPYQAPEYGSPTDTAGDTQSKGFAKPPRIQVSSTIDLTGVSGAQATALTHRIMSAINTSPTTRIDCIYYESEKQFKILLFGAMEYTEQMLKHVNVLVNHVINEDHSN